MTSDDYEHMGAFYLGRPVDAESGDTLEAPLLQAVMEYTRGNQTQAAKMLGLNRGTLRKKLKQHGIEGRG